MRFFDDIDRASRGEAWLAAERARLSKWPREELIGFAVWNDPNGTYRDRDLEEPITHDEILDVVMGWVEQNRETPEEMRRLSWR